MSYSIILYKGSIPDLLVLCLVTSYEGNSPRLPELLSKQMHSCPVCGIPRLEASRQYSAFLQTDGD